MQVFSMVKLGDDIASQKLTDPGAWKPDLLSAGKRTLTFSPKNSQITFTHSNLGKQRL